MHAAASRPFLIFLLITLLINAGGWTFNRDAMADVLFAAQESNPAGLTQFASQAGHGQGQSPKTNAACTHWCHVVGNFIGLFDQAPNPFSKPIAHYSSHISQFIPEPIPENIFRPPRLIT